MKLLQALEGSASGLADGVICALGIIVGVAAATSNAMTVVLVGIIGAIADAFGNSIGFCISQSAERGIQIHEVRKHGARHSVHTKAETIASGVASFFVTIAVFGVLLAPYAFLGVVDATIASFAAAVVVLAVLGAYVGKLAEESIWKSGLWYACLGIAGAAVSYWDWPAAQGHLWGTVADKQRDKHRSRF